MLALSQFAQRTFKSARLESGKLRQLVEIARNADDQLIAAGRKARQEKMMATVHFTSNLRRHVDCPSVESTGSTVRAVLEGAFAANPRLRTYVLDEQGGLRKHMRILVNGQAVTDRQHLSDIVKPGAQIWVMQALSGG